FLPIDAVHRWQKLPARLCRLQTRDRREGHAAAIYIPGGEEACTIRAFACSFAGSAVGAQHAAPLQRKPRPSEEKDSTQRTQSSQRTPRPPRRAHREIAVAHERK